MCCVLCAGFVPMIWGYWGQQFPALPGHDTVLGFNEPNHSGQADLDPETAAWAWLELQVCRHRDYNHQYDPRVPRPPTRTRCWSAPAPRRPMLRTGLINSLSFAMHLDAGWTILVSVS